jgi:glucosamine-6-phosphate deaminase
MQSVKSRIEVDVVENAQVGTLKVAKEIAELIKEKQLQNKPCVLGLATGSSPIKIYKELVRMHNEEGLSFENVITFNLDEYCGLENDNIQSYHYFMNDHLFKHIDVLKENINIPKGLLEDEELVQHCVAYENKITACGGLDLQLLGIGRTGHIGFNEPGSPMDSVTRRVLLNQITLDDAAPAFNGIENVPTTAVTMGVHTVLKAKRIVLLAWGIAKAAIVNEAINGEVTTQIPATFLQNHQHTTFILDEAAASNLL